MIDSELGEIPEGWSLGNFENLGKLLVVAHLLKSFRVLY